MELYYATTNAGKILSLQREFSETAVRVIQAPIDTPEPRSSDVQEIACYKVRAAYEQLKKPVAALDAGFYIPSLNGFPRAFVNFALETIDLEGMLALVQGKERLCEFRDCLAYQDPSLNEPQSFIGHTPGMLAEKPRGEIKPYHWSRLSRIFIPDGSTKTLAEMSEHEYHEWRALARKKTSPARQFAQWLLPRVSKN